MPDGWIQLIPTKMNLSTYWISAGKTKGTSWMWDQYGFAEICIWYSHHHHVLLRWQWTLWHSLRAARLSCYDIFLLSFLFHTYKRISVFSLLISSLPEAKVEIDTNQRLRRHWHLSRLCPLDLLLASRWGYWETLHARVQHCLETVLHSCMQMCTKHCKNCECCPVSLLLSGQYGCNVLV